MADVITPGNYFELAKKKKWSITVPVQTKYIFGNILFFLPAIWFWSSVVVKESLGTDYFFDVWFDQLSQNFWGNLLLLFSVVGLPGLAIGMNGVWYMRLRERITWWAIALGVVFMAIGFLALAPKS